jgi:hypothetical protein
MPTGNKRLRDRSERLPVRVLLRLLPLHTLIELNSEARLGWLRLTRRGIDRRYSSARDLLVNVGCGAEGRVGWVNIDSASAPGVDLVRDCRTAIPLPSASARGIFTEHFLEHLDYYEEAPRFLGACLRVLQPGGILRIIVPDGSKYLTGYCSGDLEDFAGFSPLVELTPGSDLVPYSIGRDIVPFRTKMEVVNFHFRQSGQHRFSYDFDTLARLLEDCGFEAVAQSEFRVSRLPELEIDQAARAQESLVVEAAAPLS